MFELNVRVAKISDLERSNQMILFQSTRTSTLGLDSNVLKDITSCSFRACFFFFFF